LVTVGKTRWGLIFAVWAAGLGAAAQYGKISVVFSRMGELYPAAGASIGFTVSLVGLLGILLGVIAGAFVASFGYRRTLVLALWTGAAMSALQALHLPFFLFLATRIIEGLSHLGMVVAAPTLIAQIASDKDRGTALTLWGTFFGVAFTLLAWLGVPLADRWGVLMLFGAHGVIMALLALGLSRALRDVPVPAREPLPGLAGLPALHLQIYRSPRKLAPAAGWLFYTTCFVAILTILPPYIDEGSRAFVMGAMPLASIAVSLTIGVYMLRHISAVQLIQTGFLLCAACMVWLWAVPGLPAACIALAGAMGLVQGASFASVPQLNGTAAARAESNGAMAQAGNLGNTLGTPLFVAATGMGGYPGLAGTALVIYLGGFAVHLFMAHQRRLR
jgi:MFS family permease